MTADHPTATRPGELRVSACPHPFDGRRVDYVVPAGLSIAEIVEVIQPDPLLRAHGLACIGEHMIARADWHRVRPKPGALLSIRLLPGGGGGALRIALMAVIAVVAVVTTVLTAGALAPVWGATMAGLAGALAGAAVSVAGTLALNALLPAPVPEVSKNYGNSSPTYAITGARNQPDPWGKLPFLLGRFKLTPPYAALPYREQVGSDMYWRAMFAISHGPIEIEEIRVGETLLDNFLGVETEFRRGYWSLTDKGSWSAASGAFPTTPAFGDSWTVSVAGTVAEVAFKAGQTITWNGLYPAASADAWDLDQGKGFALFPSDVYEEGLSIAVSTSGPAVRTTQIKCDEAAIDIVFERGLVHIQNQPPGKPKINQAGIRIEQSPRGADTWTTVLQTVISGMQQTPLYWGHRWKTAGFGAADPNGQYDVRVTASSGAFDEQRNFGNFTWYALKTFTASNAGALLPIPGVALMAIRIKASGQLSGSLDEFNVVARTIARDWDAATGTWIWRPTSQPAALCRHALQHPTRERPATDAQIDLDRLAYWDGLTRPAAREFNGVIEAKGSLWDALSKIALIGHAVPSLRDLKFSVVIDEPKTAPIRMFSPRNSWDYQGEMSHARMPHGYRIGFVNAAREWKMDDELVVYDDGYDASNATRIHRIEWLGIDDHDQAWKEGRFHLAQQRLRREVHKITVDFEHLCCERGDLVALQHDVIAVGLGSARVRTVTANLAGTLALGVILDAAMVFEAGHSYALRARRIVGGAQRIDLYPLATVVGEAATLSFATPPLLADAPAPGDLVAVGELGRETLRVLVRDIEPRADLSAVLTLIAEAPGVHVAETGTMPVYDSGVGSGWRLPAPVVLSMISDATVALRTSSRSFVDRVLFGVAPASVAETNFHVLMRLTGTDGGWLTAPVQEHTDTSIAIIGVRSGSTYDFRLQRTHADYAASPLTEVNGYWVVGREAAPIGLQNLSLAAAGGQALLRWDVAPDLDVQIGGSIVFRHSPLLSGASWANSTSIGNAVAGDQTLVWLPLKPGSYMARVYDADGRESVDVASITSKQASALAFVAVDQLRENPDFPGAKSNCEAAGGVLQLSTGDFDTAADTDALGLWDVAGPLVATEGVYKFDAGMDFRAVRPMRITSHMLVEAASLADRFDDRAGGVDEWADFDGSAGAVVDAELWGQLTDDDPAGTPTWGPAMRIDAGEITARAVGRIECWLSTDDPAFTPRVTELALYADEVS